MKIVRYKKMSNSRYKVYLDNGVDIVLYEDVILKYNLLISKDISDDNINEIREYNLECDCYYVGLNSIKSRIKTEYQLRELLKKREYPSKYIDMAIDRLKKEGYVNDRVFTRSYINNQLITTNHGPLRIEKDLLKLGVDSSIIDSEISLFSEEDEVDKINKIVKVKLKSNRNRGGSVLRRKIYNDLKLAGYHDLYINRVLNNYEFNNNSEIAKREYDKLYKRLSRKYSGAELERKIREKLFLKGLKIDE